MTSCMLDNMTILTDIMDRQLNRVVYRSRFLPLFSLARRVGLSLRKRSLRSSPTNLTADVTQLVVVITVGGPPAPPVIPAARSARSPHSLLYTATRSDISFSLPLKATHSLC
uniref:Uncharacterized protein n=1 Tax=Cucumis sativus TaxID=3659 RepID=A0A0A0LEA6_CUCSA